MGDALKSDIAADLAKMRYGRGFDEPDLALVKASVADWQTQYAERMRGMLQPFLKEGVSADTVMQHISYEFFAGLETPKLEWAYAKADVPYIEPRVVNVTRNARVVSFDLGELIERKLQHSKRFRQQMQEMSDLLKSGELYLKPPSGIMRGVEYGVKVRYHDWLARPATPEEADDLRFMWIFNCDDIEVVRRQIGTRMASDVTDPL